MIGNILGGADGWPCVRNGGILPLIWVLLGVPLGAIEGQSLVLHCRHILHPIVIYRGGQQPVVVVDAEGVEGLGGRGIHHHHHHHQVFCQFSCLYYEVIDSMTMLLLSVECFILITSRRSKRHKALFNVLSFVCNQPQCYCKYKLIYWGRKSKYIKS